tara:strand:- start:534 stop:917 length:384 start_codon:yes stop_codon:yes gene_type:complete
MKRVLFVAVCKIFLLILVLSPLAHAEKYNPMHYEIAWQAMHVIDVMQTLEIQDHEHLEESHSHWIIGRQPDDDNVYAWGIASALAHYFLMKWVDDNTKYGKVIRQIEVGYKFGVIHKNYQAGIRISF